MIVDSINTVPTIFFHPLLEEERPEPSLFPLVIESPRWDSSLRGDRFEHIIVKPDPQDNIAYGKLRWVWKVIKWILGVVGEETIRVGVGKGIEEGLDSINEGEDSDKPEKTEKEEPPKLEKEEEPEPEPEWI